MSKLNNFLPIGAALLFLLTSTVISHPVILGMTKAIGAVMLIVYFIVLFFGQETA